MNAGPDNPYTIAGLEVLQLRNRFLIRHARLHGYGLRGRVKRHELPIPCIGVAFWLRRLRQADHRPAERQGDCQECSLNPLRSHTFPPLCFAPPTRTSERRLPYSRFLADSAERARRRSETMGLDDSCGGDTELRMMPVEQPQLRDKRRFDLSSMKHADHAALGDHDGDHPQTLGNRRSREVPAAESKRQGYLPHRGVEIATRGHDDPRFRDHERPVKLRQFLHGSAEIRIRDVCPCWHMTGQWVENERTRCRQHIVCLTNREQRPDATALSTLASDLQREFKGRLENGGFTPRNPRAQGLECGDRHCVLPSRLTVSYAAFLGCNSPQTDEQGNKKNPKHGIK